MYGWGGVRVRPRGLCSCAPRSTSFSLNGSESHRGSPVTQQGPLRDTTKGQQIYFLPFVMSKGKLLLLQHEADEYGLNIKTVSYCGELLFLTQLPNTLCNRTPGWLLISSTWSLPALPARSRETTVSGWTFQSLAGHHHLPYLQALWQHTFETLLQTSLLAGRKDLRFPPQIRKGLFNLIDLSSPQWGASTNSQFRKRPKGGLEKRTGTEDEATPRLPSAGASQRSSSLCLEEIWIPARRAHPWVNTHWKMWVTRRLF